ncbi:AGAP009627-PA [Anopheles gambiae str. PEST]|uniref:AGAP009627-PA n=2 Tax=gambiae species complex TaxID=44542 RepID=Q5TPC5_ANOGA|nr:AGAP009627-PA [Anopheles gambiae str. PEST]
MSVRSCHLSRRRTVKCARRVSAGDEKSGSSVADIEDAFHSSRRINRTGIINGESRSSSFLTT